MLSRLDDFRKDPEKARTTLGFSEKDGYSKNIAEAITKNRTVEYGDVKSLNDMILVMLGWVIDINFIPTLREIKKRKLFEQLVSFLPDNEDIRKLAEHIYKRLDERILKNQ
jgi:hypothetical protein